MYVKTAPLLAHLGNVSIGYVLPVVLPIDQEISRNYPKTALTKEAPPA